jgi:site-specific recombinase XerD
MTIADFLDKKQEFLIHIDVEKNLSENTYRAYESDLDQFYTFWQNINSQATEEIPLRRALERFLIMLYHKKIDKSTIARKLSCFQSFEKYILSRGVELHLKLTRPRLDKKLPIYLSIDEIIHLLDTIKNEDLPTKNPLRDKSIFELLYATGVRCSELVNIKIDEIDFDQKIIRILGKGKKERIVLFGSKALKKLQEYIEFERQGSNKCPYLFLNNRSEQLTSRSVQRIFEMFRKFLKIERKITPHKIRHSFATHLLTQGADLRIVQELLGHKTIASTEKYTHVTVVELTELCDTLHPIHNFEKIRDKKNEGS